MANINIDQLANEIARGLQEYSQDIVEGINVSSEQITKSAVKTLKRTSPKDTGDYRKSWRVKTFKKFGQTNSHTIYNKDHYQLTHLLEKGHAKRGGRVQAKVHIRPVEEQIINDFMAEVENVIRNGGIK